MPRADAPPASSRPATLVVWTVLAASFLLTLPTLVAHPSTGIDPSWEMGLHLAREAGFVVGRDLVFNYGPWGFLNVPLTLNPSLWLAAVAYRVIIQVGLFAALALWMRRRLVGWTAALAVVPLLLFLPSPEYRFLLALVVWARLAIDTRKERPLACGVLGGVAAATMLIKFSMGLAALLVVAGAMAAAVLGGRRRSAIALGAGFVVGLTAWGWLALGSIGAIRTFVVNSMEISTGYGAALERRGPLWQPVIVLAAILLVGWGLAQDRKRGIAGPIAFALPAAGLMALTFKHAFIRHETHAFLAFAIGGALLTWIALERAAGGSPFGRALRASGAAMMIAGGIVVIPPTHLLTLPRAIPRTLADAVRAASETRDADHREHIRAELRRALPLHAQARALVGDRTVDVLTVEVAMTEAWDLRWQPRPVLQSYAVATSHLDDLDASFFASKAAPERLLVDLQGLDTRHPFMDAPRTWREILCRYAPLGRDARWLILGLRDEPLQVAERSLGRIEVPMNQVARAPLPAAGHLEMRVSLEPSWLGRLVGVPWKRPEIRLGLADENPPPARRILAATAHRPFPLIRDWPDTAEDLWNLYADTEWPSPPGVAFVTAGAWAWKPAKVEFYEVTYSPATAAR